MTTERETFEQEYLAQLKRDFPIVYDSEETIPNALPANVRIVIKRLTPNFRHPVGEYMVMIWDGSKHESVWLDTDFNFDEKLQLVSDLRLYGSHYPSNWGEGRLLMANALEFAIHYLQD